MLLSEVEVGMRVVPISKSIGFSMRESLIRHTMGSTPFVFVVGFTEHNGQTVVRCAINKDDRSADYFLASDLELYLPPPTPTAVAIKKDMKRSKLTIASLRG